MVLSVLTQRHGSEVHDGHLVGVAVADVVVEQRRGGSGSVCAAGWLRATQHAAPVQVSARAYAVAAS